MAILRTPNIEPADESRKASAASFLAGLCQGCRPSGANRRPKVTPIEVGLFVLVASTAMAIASVSLWWIPVYLAARGRDLRHSGKVAGIVICFRIRRGIR